MGAAENPKGARESDSGRGTLDDPDVLKYEAFYESVGDELANVPWANLCGNPALVSWLDQQPVPAGQRALVIGCGLGDDAEELSRRGYDVTAFDASPTAIAWCHKRFPASKVEYLVADLFHLPEEWHQHFDLVVEINTIQALPPPRHGATIAAIAGTIAPGGRLVVITFGRTEDAVVSGPPWPLSRSELAAFSSKGLRETGASEDAISNEHLSPRRVVRWRVVYERDAGAGKR